MRLSFDDDKSFKEAVGSLNFNHPQSDSDSLEGMGSSSNSMVLEGSESERNGGDIIPNDPITLRRVGSTNTLSIQETWRSGFVFNNPPSNPEFTGTSVNGM